MTFSKNDILQIQAHGLSLENVNAQVASIQQGMIFSNLKASATIGNGILKLSETAKTHYIDVFERKRNTLSMVKFVPASGAASRMFKFLFKFLNKYHSDEESIQDYIDRTKNKDLATFFENLEKLPFYEDVVQKIHDYNALTYNEQCLAFVKTMINEDQLNYSFYPKGLLPFHQYKTHTATAFEEHFYEAAFYASSNAVAHLHFTISEIHHKYFQKELRRIIKDVSEITRQTFHVSFSYQKSATDTVALTLNNEIYREANHTILFRPSGHGALLENLNDLNFDLVFIKNIDNLVVKNQLEIVCNYRKILAGILLETQDEVFNFLRQIDAGNIDKNTLNTITNFITNTLNIVVPPDFETASLTSKLFYLKEKLNRPIRVCSMVKNEGEPGGGPFWVEDKNENMSLQIIEFAQIDIENPNQKRIVESATHFNPTDLVCGVKNYKGESFNLMNYVDHDATFITHKTHAATNIKALELPGLWNGSMAHWNSIFVEVPVNTFNPVKKVNDFLRSSHQVEK